MRGQALSKTPQTLAENTFGCLCPTAMPILADLVAPVLQGAVATLAQNATGSDGSCWDSWCLERIDSSGFGIVFEFLIFIYCFIGLAIVCDDFLVPSLETLCVRWNIREDVAGATFMALGSAAPEIIVNAVTTAQAGDQVDLGVGAIIGSGMIAFCVIPSASILFSGQEKPLLIKRRPLLRDITTYSVALLCLVMFFADGEVTLIESMILCSIYVSYITIVFVSPQLHKWYQLRQLVGEEAKARYLHKRQTSFVQNSNAGQTGQGSIGLMDNQFAASDQDVEGVAIRNGSFNSSDRNSMAHSRESVNSIAESQNEDDDNDADGVEENEIAPPGQEQMLEASEKEDAGEEEETWYGAAYEKFSYPLTVCFQYTCPEAKVGSPLEDWYPLGCIMAFSWVALFSFTISSICARWQVLTNFNAEFLGLILIAVGAEIPDTIQSVTVARKGYGSMAVSNCLGSQITNILVGLGFPWFLYNVFVGKPVLIPGHKRIFRAAMIQAGNVGVVFMSMLGVAMWNGDNKAKLSKEKGYIFLSCYFVCLVIFGFLTFCHYDFCSSNL